VPSLESHRVRLDLIRRRRADLGEPRAGAGLERI